MMKRIIGLVAVVLCCVAAQGEEQTYAEKLGWPKGARVLMIHADDMGMSLASNQGSIGCFEAGTVTSASIMMPCSWVPSAIAWANAHPDACLGAHLTHTAEWDTYRWGPVAGRGTVPGLVDPNGYLYDNVAGVVAHASADEIETEIRAQIALAKSMGLDITHIDTHMGTLFETPEYFERYLKVGVEMDIPILMAGGHLTAAKEDLGEDLVASITAIAPQVWAAGLPVLDDIDTRSYNWEGTDKKAHYIQAFRELKPGVTWFNTHPTAPTEEAKVITDNREKLWGDYYALTDPEVKKVIEEEGIILTTWRELHERRKNVK
ncbi:MAG: ChbG/HpnK family deacetylase [Candidatus Hydrogenedens sp.]|nr:ChbG/HpnK family deacetylase [Candidatus Hydrogenedens sp.]